MATTISVGAALGFGVPTPAPASTAEDVCIVLGLAGVPATVEAFTGQSIQSTTEAVVATCLAAIPEDLLDDVCAFLWGAGVRATIEGTTGRSVDSTFDTVVERCRKIFVT